MHDSCKGHCARVCVSMIKESFIVRGHEQDQWQYNIKIFDLSQVPLGTTIGTLKQQLANADPTGKADPSSFDLKLPFSFGQALADHDLVPDGLAELELCLSSADDEDKEVKVVKAEPLSADSALAAPDASLAHSATASVAEASAASVGAVGTRTREEVLAFKAAAEAREAAEEAESSRARWEPPATGTFRLGELLWAGRAGLEEGPRSVFFPRHSFAAVTLPPARKGFGASLLLLGGVGLNGAPHNDVWRMSVPRLGAQRAVDGDGIPVRPKWTVVSPHDNGVIDSRGLRVMRKWRARCHMGYTSASTHEGGLLLYVAGGDDGSGVKFNDVWASQDGGQPCRPTTS